MFLNRDLQRTFELESSNSELLISHTQKIYGHWPAQCTGHVEIRFSKSND